jgi:hypothetical protein
MQKTLLKLLSEAAKETPKCRDPRLFFSNNRQFKNLQKKSGIFNLCLAGFLFTVTCEISPIVLMSRVAIAQDSHSTPSTSLSGTTPATIENSGSGVQINNSNFSGTLTAPNCTSRVCLFTLLRTTPHGAESIIGAMLNFGSAEEDRVAVERIKAEIEGKKNLADLKLALLDKLTAAIDSGNSLRIRAIAISLAPLEGYKDFREYLKALLKEPS